MYAAKPAAGACMALAICDDGDDDMPALEANLLLIHCPFNALSYYIPACRKYYSEESSMFNGLLA